MKRTEFERQLHQILARLQQIADEDQAIIQPIAAQPVTVTLAQVEAYGTRYEERQALHEELQALGKERIEED